MIRCVVDGGGGGLCIRYVDLPHGVIPDHGTDWVTFSIEERFVDNGLVDRYPDSVHWKSAASTINQKLPVRI